MTPFEKLNAVKSSIANSAAMGSAYRENWSNEFRSKEVDEVFDAKRRWSEECIVSEDEIRSMEDDALGQLGFCLWSEGDPIRLIPLWAWNYIADGARLKSINGKFYVKGEDEIDLDTRGGAIAYGIVK